MSQEVVRAEAEKLLLTFDPVVKYLDGLANGFSRDMALTKIQEACWWAQKSLEDYALAKGGTPVEAKTN